MQYMLVALHMSVLLAMMAAAEHLWHDMQDESDSSSSSDSDSD